MGLVLLVCFVCMHVCMYVCWFHLFVILAWCFVCIPIDSSYLFNIIKLACFISFSNINWKSELLLGAICSERFCSVYTCSVIVFII